jgi:CRISPR/Cas system-associated exonuclease Cas4 (RecB family)
VFPGFDEYVLEVDTITDSILEENRVERVSYSSRDFKGVFADVAARVKHFLEDTERPAIPGSKCQFCPERPVCTGQEAVDGEQLDF